MKPDERITEHPTRCDCDEHEAGRLVPAGEKMYFVGWGWFCQDCYYAYVEDFEAWLDSFAAYERDMSNFEMYNY